MKSAYTHRLRHIANELVFVLENDDIPEQTKVTLERLVDEVSALHPPAGIRSVEIHSAFKKPAVNYSLAKREGMAYKPPYEPPEGQIDVVLAANDGEEVHFRVCGVIEIIKPEQDEEAQELSEEYA